MTARRPLTSEAVHEPIGVTTPRGEHDWNARQRTTLDDARRYTRFVAIMKRALLVAAGAVILAVVAYSMQTRDNRKAVMTLEGLATVDHDLAMLKPRLTGATQDGDPFVITADSLVQLARNSRRAALNNVQADITLKKRQGWLSAVAAKGLLDADAKTVVLTEDISVFSDQGYELHTDLVDVDLGKGTVIGPHAVTGQGPLGTLKADRFDIARNSRLIHLYGNEFMTINAAAAKKKHKT